MQASFGKLACQHFHTVAAPTEWLHLWGGRKWQPPVRGLRGGSAFAGAAMGMAWRGVARSGGVVLRLGVVAVRARTRPPAIMQISQSGQGFGEVKAGWGLMEGSPRGGNSRMSRGKGRGITFGTVAGEKAGGGFVGERLSKGALPSARDLNQVGRAITRPPPLSRS